MQTEVTLEQRTAPLPFTMSPFKQAPDGLLWSILSRGTRTSKIIIYPQEVPRKHDEVVGFLREKIRDAAREIE